MKIYGLIAVFLLAAAAGVQAGISAGQWLQIQLSDWQPGTVGDPGSMFNWNYYNGITDFNGATGNTTDMVDSTGTIVSGVNLSSSGWLGVGVSWGWVGEGIEPAAPGYVVGAWEAPNHWIGLGDASITLSGLDTTLSYNVKVYSVHDGSAESTTITLNGSAIGPVAQADRWNNPSTDYAWSGIEADAMGNLKFTFNSTGFSFVTAIVVEAVPVLIPAELLGRFGKILTGGQANLCANAPMLPYDVICPKEWLLQLQEAFVINPASVGLPGWEDRVCLKFKSEPDRYYSYTVSEAKQISFLATKIDAAGRTEIPRATLTHNSVFAEGDPQLWVDGETIYMTGVSADATSWVPVIDIYESPMYPANGEEFDFSHKARYDPSAIDPRFDYYSVAGELTAKEGSKYVLTFFGYRVPEGKPQSWAINRGIDIQTIFYQMASKDVNGDFVWEGLPRMFNAYVDNIDIGNDLGDVHVVMPGPRTHQSWDAPSGGQINGLHLSGDIFEIDGERWFYWVWFENGNHVASARIADTFSFADLSNTKRVWHEPVNVVQNSNPVAGEQGINENATAFKRNGKYYFIFTHGHVIGNYGMSYFIGDSFETIARDVGQEYLLFDTYPNLGDEPFHTPGLREIAGSGRAIAKTNGDMFMFYGIGTFNQAGDYQGRKIHYSKLSFNPDGTIVPLKEQPRMQLDPHRIPASIQLSWTDRTDYEYHLNALVGGQQLIEHPTNPAGFGMGHAQLHAGFLGSSTSWNLTEIEFVSTTYPGQNEMIPISDLDGLDGFQLSYAYQGNWGSQETVTVGYNRQTSQHIHFDVSVAEGIHLSWDDLENYEYHLNVLQNGSDVVDIPGYGSGYCYLDADDLGFSSYIDLHGFYFNPTGTTQNIWMSMDGLPDGYQYNFQISYAYHGNWHIASLRGAVSAPFNGTLFQHLSPNHTIAHWRFEDGTAGMAQVGTADVSGNGNNLLSQGSDPQSTSNRPFTTIPQIGAVNNLAVDFDPSASNELGTGGTMIDSYDFTAGWTIECSFRLNSLGYQVLVGKDGRRGDLGGAVGSEAPFWLKLLGFNNHLEVLAIDNTDNAHWTGTLAPIVAGQWYSVAATYDNAEMKLWLRGSGDTNYVFQSSAAFNDGIALGGFSNVWVVGRGMYNGAAVDWVDGVIDEVRISNVALDPQNFLNAAVEENHDFDFDGMADAWELEYFDSTALGVPGGNPDGDELDTFGEYALGGDPTLDDAVAYLPSAGFTPGWVTYVYNRRLDAAARGLTYGLNWSDDLLAGWTYIGTSNETERVAIDADFESVTNEIPVVGLGQGFVTLEVSSDK